MKNVKVGDQVPALIKHCTLTSMIAYAGATWDWHRLHYDHDYLKSKGLSAPVVDHCNKWLRGIAFAKD